MDNYSDYLNIAASVVGTITLGPGLRSVIWVQGCPFHCEGCISPEWIVDKEAHLVKPDILAKELLENPEVTGITISGGEPMLQARNLTLLIQAARKIRDVDVICFTGFEIEKLRSIPMAPRVTDLLSNIDVLIDGKYIQDLNNNQGMRGSSNQRIIHLTDRLLSTDFEHITRQVEVRVLNGQLLFVGVPPIGMLPHLIKKVDLELQRIPQRMEEYERT